MHAYTSYYMLHVSILSVRPLVQWLRLTLMLLSVELHQEVPGAGAALRRLESTAPSEHVRRRTLHSTEAGALSGAGVARHVDGASGENGLDRPRLYMEAG